jgi:DNA polymerase
MVLHIDFESASACDLRAEGLARYMEDLSTVMHCMGYAFDDEEPELWIAGQPLPQRIADHVEAGGLVYAHNAAFELGAWNHVMGPSFDWPRLRPEQVRCTMAMAYAMALPGALENAAPALGIEQRKDAVGKRVMMQLCKPRDDGRLWRPEDDPAKFEILYAYCKQDVVVERALHQRMLELSPDEQKLWQLDYKINQRGVAVDIPAIRRAIKLVEAEKTRLNGEMLKATGGVVGSCSEVQLLVKWIRLQGVEIKGLAKADVLDALADNLHSLPANVRQALLLRQEAAKSSTAKLVAMEQRANADGRVRGTKQYHGAATGRWGGRGMQTDNFIRPRKGIEPADIDAIIANYESPEYLDMMYGPVMDAVADSMRGLIVAKDGHDLLAVDFTNIEGRVLAWLAGEQWKLDAFREYDAGTGPDLYILTYARSFGIDHKGITKKDPRRTIGKVEDLAFGFQGGKGAWRTMSRNYPDTPHLDDAEVDEVKDGWRAAHPRIKAYWFALQDAFKAAMTEGGVHSAGHKDRQVHFRVDGSFMWCKLPSGRVLCYPYPWLGRAYTITKGGKQKKVSERTLAEWEAKEWRVTRTDEECIWYMSVDSVTNKWVETDTYGGSLANNVTQGTARDLLAHSMFNLESSGFPVVAHIHDEAVVEIASSCDADTLGRIETLFAKTPAWAAGLPVSAEGWRARRYRK